MTVVVEAEARADITHAYGWYLERSPEVARAFLVAVRKATERLGGNPSLYAVRERGLRRAPVGRFPYGLFFVEREGLVVVVACFHVRRDPRRLEGRDP